ncbi:bacterial condensin subunit MukB [Shewanella sp. ANA-3]|nr:bacterial condensin subunit MukB [Shewanella sp. ANA-3]
MRNYPYIKSLSLVGVNGVSARTLDLVNPHEHQTDRQYGTVVSLLGKNGSGKTTLLGTFMLALLPDIRSVSLGTSDNFTQTQKMQDAEMFERLGNPSLIGLEVVSRAGERALFIVRSERETGSRLKFDTFRVGLFDSLAPLDFLIVRNGNMVTPRTIDGIRDIAAEHGCRLQSFDKIDKYMLALFNDGILPRTFNRSNERYQLGQIFHSAMSGKRDQAIGRDLADFLMTHSRTNIKSVVDVLSGTMRKLRQTRDDLAHNSKDYAFFKELLEKSFTVSAKAWAQAEYNFSRADKEATSCRQDVSECKVSIEKSDQDLTECRSKLDTSVENRTSLEQESEQLKPRLASAVEGEIFYKQGKQASVSLLKKEAQLYESLSLSQLADEGADASRNKVEQANQDILDIQAQLADVQERFILLEKKAGQYRNAKSLLDSVKSWCGDSFELAKLKGMIEEYTAQSKQLALEADQLGNKLNSAENINEIHAKAASLIRRAGDSIDPNVAKNWFISTELRLEEERPLAVSLEQMRNGLSALKRNHRTVNRMLDRFKQAKLPRMPSNESEYQQLTEDRGEALESAKEVKASVDARYEDERHIQEELKIEVSRLKSLRTEWQNYQPAVARLYECFPDTQFTAEMLDGLIKNTQRELRSLRENNSRIESNIFSLKERILSLSNRETGSLETLQRFASDVGGVAVADLYSDIPLEEAGFTEAALGQLMCAIVVNDPSDAARTLLAEYGDNWPLPDVILMTVKNHSPDQLRSGGYDADLFFKDLSQEFVGADLDLNHNENDVPWVVLSEPFGGIRVSGVPTEPVLGKEARDKLIADLQIELNSKQTLFDSNDENISLLQSGLEQANRINVNPSLAFAVEPNVELKKQKLQQQGNKVADLYSQTLQATNRVKTLELQCSLLEQHADSSDLLDVNFDKEIMEAEEQIIRSEKAKKYVDRYGGTFSQIKQQYPKIREDYQSDIDTLKRQHQLAEQDLSNTNNRKRDLTSLNQVANHLADDYEQAQNDLAKEDGNVSSLRERHKQKRVMLDELKVQLRESEDKARKNKEVHLKLQSEYSVLEEQVAESKRSLSKLTYPYCEGLEKQLSLDSETISKRLRAAQEQCESLQLKQVSLTERHNTLLKQVESLQSTSVIAEEARENANGIKQKVLDALPAGATKHKLEQEMDVYFKLMHEGEAVQYTNGIYAISGLVNRYGLSRDDEFSQKINSFNLEGGTTLPSLCQLHSDAISLFRRQARGDIIRSSEPTEMLTQLDSACSLARRTLESAEEQFLTDRNELGNAIARRVQDEQKAIRRLSAEMIGISFGQVAAIRLVPKSVPHFEATLKALRGSDDVMDDLFNNAEDVEEALATLYQKTTGGRIEGEKLLDHKNYINVVTEIQRVGSEEFELLDDKTLSTGERIGSGLVVLIAILKNWGRVSHEKQPFLIPLVMDEASRLDSDAQRTVHQLAVKTGSQIVIAAPESQGKISGVGYQLVRSASKAGNKESRVIISGIRDADSLGIDEEAFIDSVVSGAAH